MLFLLIGAAVVLLFWGSLNAFARADVRSVKRFVAWLLALGGITLAVLLVLSGRAGVALSPLLMFGPLIWQHWQARLGRPGAGSGRPGTPPPRGGGPMTRAEAYAVLGLPAGAREPEIRAAHHRLMRAAHPDLGGSDWIAARINQARDILLGG
jgi:hypothetical protein